MGRQIRATTGTTHPAMIKLFKDVFGDYGKVRCISCRHKKRDEIPRPQFDWTLQCDLDQSFKFLARKPKGVPNWILDDDEYFLHFLAGYFDSEGTINITKHGIYLDLRLWLHSEDSEILKGIKDKLGKLLYHPILRIAQKKGERRHSRNYWQLDIHKRAEVLSAREIQNIKRWSEVKDKVIALRETVHAEVERCVNEAREDYEKRH
jgi:intein-encoded DNA endonuclease-like protein